MAIKGPVLVVASVTLMYVLSYHGLQYALGHEGLLRLPFAFPAEKVPWLCVLLTVILQLATFDVYLLVRSTDPGYDVITSNKNPRQGREALTGLNRRMLAAHNNATEWGGPFLGAVVACALNNAPAKPVATLCIAFLYARVAHPVMYWLNIDGLRSLAFIVGMTATVWLYVLAIGPEHLLPIVAPFMSA